MHKIILYNNQKKKDIVWSDIQVNILLLDYFYCVFFLCWKEWFLNEMLVDISINSLKNI